MPLASQPAALATPDRRHRRRLARPARPPLSAIAVASVAEAGPPFTRAVVSGMMRAEVLVFGH